jgi:glutaredoxin-related protein
MEDTLQERIQGIIDSNDVVLFMKDQRVRQLANDPAALRSR